MVRNSDPLTILRDVFAGLPRGGLRPQESGGAVGGRQVGRWHELPAAA